MARKVYTRKAVVELLEHAVAEERQALAKVQDNLERLEEQVVEAEDIVRVHEERIEAFEKTIAEAHGEDED